MRSGSRDPERRSAMAKVRSVFYDEPPPGSITVGEGEEWYFGGPIMETADGKRVRVVPKGKQEGSVRRRKTSPVSIAVNVAARGFDAIKRAFAETSESLRGFIQSVGQQVEVVDGYSISSISMVPCDVTGVDPIGFEPTGRWRGAAGSQVTGKEVCGANWTGTAATG